MPTHLAVFLATNLARAFPCTSRSLTLPLRPLPVPLAPGPVASDRRERGGREGVGPPGGVGVLLTWECLLRVSRRLRRCAGGEAPYGVRRRLRRRTRRGGSNHNSGRPRARRSESH